MNRWKHFVVAAALLGCSGDPADTTDPADTSDAATSGTATRSEGPASAEITTTTTTAAITTTTTTAAITTTTPTEPTATTATTATTDGPAPAVGDPSVAVELVGEFDQPVDLAVRPGDAALWIVEQAGRVVRFDGTGRAVALDIADRVSRGGEQGLLGLEFSPDGTLAYTNHTDTSGTTVITEWTPAPGGTFGSERTVLTVDQPFENHNAGDLAFGPDGMLYIPLGDGGSGGDPQRLASDPTTLLGSLLRIDPTPSGEQAYTIPLDNPFATGAFGEVAGAPEVWAWGLRNPWKVDFDPVTGQLWIADVGQNEFEEINVVAPDGDKAAGFGDDFGWSAFEGNARFNEDVPDTGRTTPPVLTYDHGDGCSISGGAVYRGAAIAELEPAYVYSDFCAGTIWALDLAGARNLTLVEGLEGVSAVRSGPERELYVLQRTGPVYRLVPG